MNQEILDKAFESYIHTALWSSTDDSEMPMDSKYSIDDFDKDNLLAIKVEFEKFFNDYSSLLTERDIHSGLTYDNFAHDFWLTRNGHGAGFWDKEYENRETLTSLSSEYRELNLVVGDDGKVYGE